MNTQTQTQNTTAGFCPMLPLREGLYSGIYVKGENGQPNNGDALASMLGSHSGPVVVAACLIALALPANPYETLNLGQQSMNLRNRLRAALRRGDFGMGVVVEALEEAEATATGGAR